MHTFHCKCRCSCGSHIEWDGSWEMLGAGDEMEEIRTPSTCFYGQ